MSDKFQSDNNICKVFNDIYIFMQNTNSNYSYINLIQFIKCLEIEKCKITFPPEFKVEDDTTYKEITKIMPWIVNYFTNYSSLKEPKDYKNITEIPKNHDWYVFIRAVSNQFAKHVFKMWHEYKQLQIFKCKNQRPILDYQPVKKKAKLEPIQKETEAVQKEAETGQKETEIVKEKEDINDFTDTQMHYESTFTTPTKSRIFRKTTNNNQTFLKEIKDILDNFDKKKLAMKRKLFWD